MKEVDRKSDARIGDEMRPFSFADFVAVRLSHEPDAVAVWGSQEVVERPLAKADICGTVVVRDFEENLCITVSAIDAMR